MLCKDIIIESKGFKYYFKYLEWDSEFFNKPSYLLDMARSNIGIDNKIKNDINNKFRNSFVTVKLDTAFGNNILSFLQECEFNYIDTEVVLEYTSKVSEDIPYNVKVIKKEENSLLPYDILGKAFSLTRFHSEVNIDNELADTLWINYLKNYELSETKHMFVAEVDEQTAGVILVNVNNNIATLFFVAVLEEYQGLGIGKVLINKAMEYFKTYIIKTETQVQNIQALNFYIRNGLNKVDQTLSVLHRWE